ncbi:MAG TPA: DUF2017 family protein [Microbacterium sp.]|nr:DUF2017 family protein [Microbacterium sp.]
MTPGAVLLDLTRAEAVHLSMLVRDLLVVLDGSPADDPAVARLVPSAYPDDEAASADFRSLTEADLLAARRADAETVIDALGPVDAAMLDSQAAHEVVPLAVDAAQLPAWLRTLTALRLVLASRIGITDEDAQPVDDPRYGIYEWLASRLDQLVETATGRD